MAFAADVLEGHAPRHGGALAVGRTDRGVGVAPGLVLVEVGKNKLHLILADVPRFQLLEHGDLGLRESPRGGRGEATEDGRLHHERFSGRWYRILVSQGRLDANSQQKAGGRLALS